MNILSEDLLLDGYDTFKNSLKSSLDEIYLRN